jgi:CubicO group peptidase (beta-lactamase class C family)
MKSVVYTATAAQRSGQAATPHTRKPSGDIEPIDWYPDDNQIRASGSVKTSARDLGRWLRFQLAGGVIDGKRVLSAKTLAETHTPQVVCPPEPDRYPPDDVTQISYGLGWRILDYRGVRMLEHGGAVDGFRARIVLLPKQRLGLVVCWRPVTPWSIGCSVCRRVTGTPGSRPNDRRVTSRSIWPRSG